MLVGKNPTKHKPNQHTVALDLSKQLLVSFQCQCNELAQLEEELPDQPQ